MNKAEETERAMMVQALRILATREPDGVIRIKKSDVDATAGQRVRMKIVLVHGDTIELRFEGGH